MLGISRALLSKLELPCPRLWLDLVRNSLVYSSKAIQIQYPTPTLELQSSPLENDPIEIHLRFTFEVNSEKKLLIRLVGTTGWISGYRRKYKALCCIFLHFAQERLQYKSHCSTCTNLHIPGFDDFELRHGHALQTGFGIGIASMWNLQLYKAASVFSK